MFALLPYYWLHPFGAQGRSRRIPRLLLRLLVSRITFVVLMLLAAGLTIQGLAAGDPAAYSEAYSSSQFVHVMTIDLGVLTFLAVYAIYQDCKRQGKAAGYGLLGLLPILGLLFYVLNDRGKTAKLRIVGRA
ncbi:hypothetical protein ACFPYJ_11625 [Paenibacillus solisilvae]|uniref:DUF2834 domain-containing protein n=1 Tax=Paenibacillus solisilvae TaxID=2486751 RepID=A0ABW0VYF8_9BACL